MLCTSHKLILVTGPIHPCTISTPLKEHSTETIPALETFRLTRYSTTPKWSKARESEVPWQRCLIVNPLIPHDALKHNLTSLKTV